jgi:hypothetical protein
MAGFDPSLDKELFSKKVEFANTTIKVSVMSYNNGQPKLQLSRENARESGEVSFAKLGRLTKQEAEAVLPIMQEAISKM